MPYWWVWSFVGWALLSIALSLQFSGAQTEDWVQSLWRVGQAWIVWPFLSPLFYLLAHRAPLEPGVWKRHLPVHLGAGAAAWLFAVFAQEELHLRFHPPPEGREVGRRWGSGREEPVGRIRGRSEEGGEERMRGHAPPHGGPRGEGSHGRPPRHDEGRAGPPGAHGHVEGRRRVFFSWQNAVFLLAVLSGSNALYFRRMSVERARAALELEASLNEARLRALAMQLRPHFLFNALNSVAALVHEDPDRAEDMLVALADFLRLVLQAPEQNEICLEQELEFARRYLAVEMVRFAGRLEVSEQLASGTRSCLVPFLVLQPALENAFQHGFAGKREDCRLRIEARLEGGNLLLRVADNGPGCGLNFKEGTGLGNTRARLAVLYGERATLRIFNEEGCVVEFLLPTTPERGSAS